MGQVALLTALQLHGWQSLCIDSGRAEDWADTFTHDGRFESPSYPEPAVGRDELVAFAQRFSEESPRLRHVIVNTHVTDIRSSNEFSTRAYLMIMGPTTSDALSAVTPATPTNMQVVRFTTIDDNVVRVDGHFRVRRRQVTITPT